MKIAQRVRAVFGTAVLVCVALATGVEPAAAQDRPTLEPRDYGQWETLGAYTLSPDGTWLAYTVRRVNEEHELRIRSEDQDSARVVPFGSQATFSQDGRWLAYQVGVAPDAQDEDARPEVGLLDLRSGADTTFQASSFDFSDDGLFMVLRGYGGGNILVRDLSRGSTLALGNVEAFQWSPQGHLLALTLSTQSGEGNGVQLLDPGAGALRPLVSSNTEYKGLTWRDDDDDLVVMRAREDDGFDEETHEILVWRDLASGAGAPLIFDPSAMDGFPENMRVTQFFGPEWSEDGRTLFFGIRPREASDEGGEGEETAEEEPAEEEGAQEEAAVEDEAEDEVEEDDIEPSDVEIWHARDQRIIPQQRAQASRDQRRTLLSAWRMDEGSFLQIGTDLMNNQAVVEGGRWATETTQAPYAWDVMFGRPWQDVYVTDVATGERTLAVEKIRYFWGGSPGGQYLVYFHGQDWHTYDLDEGRSANVTEALDASFTDTTYDFPVQQFPAWGFVPGGWLENDDGVFVYDEHDVWLVNPDGSGGTRLTDGAGDHREHRLMRLDPDADAYAVGEPIYLRLWSNRTKASGYGRLEVERRRGGFDVDGSVETLVFEDASLGRLTKATQANRFAFTRERFDDSPDVFVGDDDLADAEQWSETNPFQSDYAWGRSELIEFTSQAGVPLQGMLRYPANYVEGETYPMIVYTYEILSNGLHRYQVPSERNYYGQQVWSQEGYFVLNPDIVYRPRDPGVSAVDAVVPAVQAVVDMGLVDPERVGLVGHSWGGYQATYIPTRTDIFATSIAGAPLTNFLSMVGTLHWNPGMPELEHWETGQARMDVPPWEDFEAHVRNSPAAFIQDLNTPMLMMQGSEDGVVDFTQGVEFYNYARRAGKEFVFLVYPGADHGLRDESNQVDYHRRILEWFGHYLKGEDPPKWITEGVSWMEREKEIGR